MKKIFAIIKKIIISAFFIYSYNLIAVKFNMIIPINIITISLVSLFGMPAMFFLIASMLFVF